jgi:hypothetical protein
MTRIARAPFRRRVRRTEVSPEEQHYYDEAVRLLGGTPGTPEFEFEGLFAVLMASAPLCALAARMTVLVIAAIERGNSFSQADLEFTHQVLAVELRTNVMGASHWATGVVEENPALVDERANGVRLAASKALRHGHQNELTDDEQLLLRYIQQVISGTVDDGTWQAMKERLTERGLVEFTSTVLWLVAMIRILQAVEYPEPSDDEVDEVIARSEAGNVEDWGLQTD